MWRQQIGEWRRSEGGGLLRVAAFGIGGGADLQVRPPGAAV
jgi:hypothetical protein